MGNFSSKPFAPVGETVRSYKEGFERFGQLLRKHENLLDACRILLIPGPQDPGKDVLPKPAIVNSLTGNICDIHPNIVLCSNPCRVRIGTREVVFCREDIQVLARVRVFVSCFRSGVFRGPRNLPNGNLKVQFEGLA